MEQQHSSTNRFRTIGLTALAVLVALVAAVSSSSAEPTASTAAPAAQTQGFETVPAQAETTPDARPDKEDCPEEGGAASDDSSGSTAPSTTTPAPSL